MFTALKNHPFAVKAFFKQSVVFTFAFPKEDIQHLIPACLRLDTFNNQWAFIAAAIVETKNLRPKGFPSFTGNDFFLVGYRVFVRYTNNEGKNLRGLYILKSETDKTRMEFLGNIFTHYNYTTTDIEYSERDNYTKILSAKSCFMVEFEVPENEAIPLPQHSPFADWKEARRFAGPLPFTFTYNEKTKEVLIIEGVRENWKPLPVKVMNCHFSFFDSSRLNNPALASAFIINNIPYWWKKGRKEKWKQ